jgi:hypothetical protein
MESKKRIVVVVPVPDQVRDDESGIQNMPDIIPNSASKHFSNE